MIVEEQFNDVAQQRNLSDHDQRCHHCRVEIRYCDNGEVQVNWTPSGHENEEHDAHVTEQVQVTTPASPSLRALDDRSRWANTCG